jgi:signal transduction histidine kinase
MVRLMPDTMRGRLALTIVIFSLAVTGVAAGLVWMIAAQQEARSAESSAGAHLTSFSVFLSQERRALDDQVVGLTEWDQFYARTQKPSTEFTNVEVKSWLASHAGTSTVVWEDSRGRILYQQGLKEDVARLSALGDQAIAQPVSGLTRLARGPAIVVVRPITGFPARQAVGFLAVARPLDATVLRGFTSASGGLQASLVAQTSSGGDTELKSPPAGFGATWLSLGADRNQIVSDLIGVNGIPAGRVMITSNDGVDLLLRSLRTSTALALVLAVISGLLLALVISRSISTPFARFAADLQRQSASALESGHWDTTALTGARVPREFRELGLVFEELLTDLSVRQQGMQEAARSAHEAEQALLTVVDGSLDAKILIEDGVIRVANPAVTACFGIPSGRLVGMRHGAAMRPVHFVRETGAPIEWEELVQESLSDRMTVRLALPGRGERWLEIRAVRPRADDSGQILVTGRDVTDSRQLEDLRAEVISMISHDLRSPLTVIVGYIDMLRAGELPEEMRDRALASARSNADRMERMLEDLLSAARAKEAYTPTEFLPVDLTAFVEEVVESTSQTTPDRTIEMVVDEPSGTTGEEGRLRQALVNLVGNAIKYSPEKTTVTVRVGREGPVSTLIVDDEGEGISEEDRARVFDRFTRLDGASGKAKGMGLGLYIVRAIAESHGGRVYADVAPSGGARFVIELPAVELEPQAAVVDPRD